MNYNSFTQKNKLPNAELNNQIQANNISLQEWIAKLIDKQIIKTQPHNQNITISNSWDSEWETIEATVVGGITYNIYKSWTINLGEINYNWLNKFQIEIVCRNGTDGDGDSSGFEVQSFVYFKKFIGWDIKDLESNPSSDIKTVKLMVSIYSYTPGVLPIFQVKLLVKYLDQSNRD